MEREGKKVIIIDRQALLIQLGSSYCLLKSTDLVYCPRLKQGIGKDDIHSFIEKSGGSQNLIR